ncbi:MAG: alkaline phosphatase family protein, partial [Verrucomicrobia bacterium]|nr:alkaline phosphatase family protein [Verrucomicrobiota bacterium]
EALSKQGITSGVWGAMNASRAGAEKCLFFIPDPWTASERAYPEELNDLLEPLRFASKSYAKPKMAQIGKIFKLFSSYKLLGKVIREAPRLCKNIFRFRAAHCVFISFLDLLSTELFLAYKKRYNPRLSVLFLNSLAHLQHHHWHAGSSKLQEGLSYMDQILGRLFDSLAEGDLFFVANALSQKNTHEEHPWILYRQKDPQSFPQAVGMACKRVEPHMTHDAHLYFDNAEQCQTAKEALEGATLLGRRLFFVETYADPCKLFYRICFTDPVSQDVSFTFAGKSVRFFDLFQAIVQRTGKHIPYGTVFTNASNLPPSMKNHELFHYIARELRVVFS